MTYKILIFFHKFKKVFVPNFNWINMRKFLLVILLLSIGTIAIHAQNSGQHKGSFVEPRNEFWDSIKVSIENFEKKEKPKKKRFILDFSDIKVPDDLSLFKQIWHNQPVKQGATGTCWSFAATSFLESEAKRIHNKEVKMSEMHTVWYQYIEKARRYIRERGDSEFGEGSQTNAVIAMWKQYGCVPDEIFNGKKPNQEHHNHGKMFQEMKSYLEYCKNNTIWNEGHVLENIKSIMRHYIGEPPIEFTWAGRKYTPHTFRDDYLKLNLDDYVDIMSLLEQDFWQKTIYDVPDNWWKSHDYFNVPLNDFMKALRNAVRNGYSFTLSGDVSEAGHYSYADAGVVPSFDIPAAYIDDYARQFRFSNGSTGDDHAIHLVGWYEENGENWYLIKDSGSGANNGKFKGYYLYHEDYIKLKMTCFLVHKDAVKELLSQFERQSKLD